MAQQALELRVRYRPAVQIPLRLVAAYTYEIVELCLGLHTLGDGGHVKCVRQTDDGRDERTAFAVGGKTGRERAIDLQRIDGQLGQAAQRGKPRSEIIDGDAYARSAQHSERMDARRGVADQCSLADLDIDAPIRIAGEIADGLEDLARGIAAPQFRGRNVDGDSDGRQSHAAPAAAIKGRLPEDPRANCRHQTGGLEHRQKYSRRDQSVFRVLPTQ